MTGRLLSTRWDEEYRSGRYSEDAPLPFVETILSVLDEHDAARNRPGLYVGCGNGRNYLPLADAGLNLYGIDISVEAVGQLATRRPALSSRLLCADFGDLRRDTGVFGYVIAIQVFQHGDREIASSYFDATKGVLAPGGLLFLRVNSATTEVYLPHTVVERDAWGGFTVRYDEGPKSGLLVHFYSWDELLRLTGDGFQLLKGPREDVIPRDPPKTGCWAQWEAVWQKR